MNSITEDSAPGFGVIQRRRDRAAVSARDAWSHEREARHDHDVNPFGVTMAASVDALVEQLGDLELAIELGDEEHAFLAETSDSLRDVVATVGAGIIEARYAGEQADPELIGALRRTIDCLTAELHEVRTRGAQVESELRGRVDDLELALGDLRRRLIAQNEEMERLRGAGDIVRARLSDTEAFLRATHSELVKARIALGESRRELEETRSNLAEAEAESALMEEWLNSATSRCAMLERRVWELEADQSGTTRAVA